MKSCKPIYEFIVWENCNNNCKFCFQRENPRLFNAYNRRDALLEVLRFISSNEFIQGSHILLVGGEIFHLNTNTDIEAIIFTYRKILEAMTINVIDLLYFNTNLIYKDLTLLEEVLNMVKEYNLMSRVRFTTSFDIDGRFKNTKDLQQFIKNLYTIRNKYPELHLVTNMILTKVVCEKIISGEMSIKDQMNVFGCWINLIPYIVYDEQLSATREQIFTALRIVDDENEGYLKRYINNLDLDQDKLVYINNKGNFELCKSDENTCGHSINFTRYSKKGSCYICDLKGLFNGRI